MKAIKQRLGLFAGAGSLGLVASSLLLFREEIIGPINFDPALILSLLFSGLMFCLLFRENSRYRAAKLITENKLMHIQTAKIEERISDTGCSHIDGIEVIVSCFGILLDSKVIQFNMNGIDLKGVEIGRESICFSYNTSGKDRSIQILHGELGNREIQSFTEKFTYETGIEPIMVKACER